MSKKNLIIVESPAKAKTINKIMGSNFIVKASMGHVRDLPQRKLGVDISEGFKPQYVTIKTKEKVIKELKDNAKQCEYIYLAPDPDREGEAIAWHLVAALKRVIPEDHFYRVTYNEITESAIRKAFDEPKRIDLNKVDSQQARRVLDRIVGYMVSPLLWRRIKGGSSAGRVQSVALRLVCEREDLIQNFVPEEYWLLGARVKKKVEPVVPFQIKLARIDGDKAEVKSESDAKNILADVEGRKLLVSNILEKQISKKAQPPYITSTLQQAGSRFYGFTPSRTMRIAQDLYEGMDFGEGPVGLITYMRTDSVSVSKEAQEQSRAYIEEQYGEEYVPKKPNVYKSRGSAQEAHEAIRPTDVSRTPTLCERYLKPDELKLYKIIWQRFVASQMSPARIAQKTIEVEAEPEEQRPKTYLFRTSMSQVVFPGYMKAMGDEDSPKKKSAKPKETSLEEDEAESLPPLEKGEQLDCLEWLSEQKFTQPPGRYTEASLVRALEENGVGRPSTYAQILYTLQERKYVEKEKRSLRPTDLGMNVNTFLITHLGDLFNVKFTAGMEEALDKIERGSVEWTKMLDEFYSTFQDWVERVKGPAASKEEVLGLLEVLGQVTEWGPEVKRGKRTYGDERFTKSIQKQLDDGKRPISARQLEALKKLVCKYRNQISSFDAILDKYDLKEILAEVERPVDPPREDSIEKLSLLKEVSFDEPKKVGKRTYDDKAFCESLREQVERGKRLSDNQVAYLDKLVFKYADQLKDFESLSQKWALSKNQAEADPEAGALLDHLKAVKEWKPPAQRGKRVWDDSKFFESLHSQYSQKRALSVKQVASLKKMVKRYADQIPNYDAVAAQFGITPSPSKKTNQDKPKEE